MLKNLKKLISLVLVLALSVVISLPAFAATEKNKVNDGSAATDIVGLLSNDQYIKEQETRVNEQLGIKPEEVEQYRSWLKNSQEKGYFLSDGEGHIKVDSAAEQIVPTDMWEEYLSRINTINKLIDIGIYSFSEKTGLKSHALDCIKNPPASKTTVSNSGKMKPMAEVFELGEMVHQNFAEIEAIYVSSGYATAVAYWVYEVQPNGDWDYKNQDGFKGESFMCYYGSSDGKHAIHNAEWIGNYNYGYTGHVMFNLSILHAGSAAVGGGVEKDKHDWPAIDAGYNDSGNIEW